MTSSHPKSTLIAVVRHGSTDWNLERRIQGHSNNSLNQQGIRDAQTAVATLQHYAKSAQLAGVDEEQFCWRGITTSPLERAAATARLIADGLNGLPIGVDSELIERDYGSAEGLPVSKANELWPELVIPDAETSAELRSRAAAALKRHLFTYPATILVTHGAWMRAGLSAVTGSDIPRISNGEIWLLSATANSPGVIGANSATGVSNQLLFTAVALKQL